MGNAIFMGDSKASDSRIDAGLLLTNNSLDNFDILKLIQDYKIENGIANDDIESSPYAFNAEKFQEYIKSHLEEEITKHKLLKEASEIVASVKADHLEDLKNMPQEESPSRSRGHLNNLRLKTLEDTKKEAVNSHGNPVKWASKEEIDKMIEEFKKLHKQQEDLMMQCINGESTADSTFNWSIDMYWATEKLKRALVDKIISEKFHDARVKNVTNFMNEYSKQYNELAEA